MSNTPAYQYHGLMAQTWDLFRGDTSGWSDRWFYREIVARHGGSVLDVGCGTGRILLDFLAEDIDIEGVDDSPEMLALCREKAAKGGIEPVLYCQKMDRLDLPRRYATILVPSSSFQLLTDPAEAREALRRFAAHLLPGGVLALPFMRLWQEGEPLDTGWVLAREQVRPEDGVLFRKWVHVRFDPIDGCEHTRERFEAIVEERVVAEELHERSPDVRSYTLGQAIALLEEAGLNPIDAHREFTFEPAQPGDRTVSLVGHAPTIRTEHAPRRCR
jgi:SAM-dependent methyltransferase